MLTKNMQEALNDQIKNEISSAYISLSMSAFCEAENLPGFAKWLRVQWQEELEHGLKMFDYVAERGGVVLLQGIEKPAAKWKSPLDVFEHVLAHEQKVTASIHRLYEVALREKDYPSQVMLQWFISEQVEEEKNVTEIIELMKRAGNSGPSLLMMDRQLGMRAKG